MKGKKGFFIPMATLGFIGIIALLLWFAGVFGESPLKISGGNLQVASTPTTTLQGSQGVPAGARCPDTLATNVYFQALNPWDKSGTTDYQNTTIAYWKAGSSVITTIDTRASAALSDAASLDCGATYFYTNIVQQDEANATGFVPVSSFVAEGPSKNIQLKVSDSDAILMRVYDEEAHNYVYGATGNAAGGNTTAEVDVNAAEASTVSFTSTTDGDTALAIGTSDLIQYCAMVRVNDVGGQYHGVKDFLLIDADASDYDLTTATVSFNGVELTKLGKSALADNDQGYVSGYELVYRLDENGAVIDEKPKNLCVTISTKSSGTIDADMIWMFASTANKANDFGDGVEEVLFDSGGNPQYREMPVVTFDMS
ncbi:MAG: hypothetical protein EHM12_10940 [Dehalococcoidia bacterium]|nr:MAG: hypothetical protein EHM12_10940 [Dehalococcoidia bacterium]